MGTIQDFGDFLVISTGESGGDTLLTLDYGDDDFLSDDDDDYEAADKATRKRPNKAHKARKAQG